MKAYLKGKAIVIDPNRVRGGVDTTRRDHGKTKAPGSTVAGGQRSRERCSPRAGENPAPAPTYDSKLEADYATYLNGLKLAPYDIRDWVYHPWTFRLPGGVTYTPDFLVIHSETFVGQWCLEIIEVKGSRKMKGARDSITRFRIARGLFPCFHFKLIDRYRGQWRQIE